MTEDLYMPAPVVSDLRKASKDELVTEVMHLRQFIGLMLLNLRDFREATGLNEEQNHRLLELETGLERLESVARHGREKLIPELEMRIAQRLDMISGRLDRLEGDRP